MKSFEKLLDTVRKNDPNLISEEAAQELLTNYNEYETQLQDDAFNKGKAAGFEEGYHEGIEKQKATCQQEFDALLAKYDEDATNKLETIVKTLNDDHAAKLQEIYDMCCANMVPASEVQAMDEDHAAKFQAALEAIDAAHAKKLNIAVESVRKSFDDNATKKLLHVKNLYSKTINESADQIKSLQKKLHNERSRKLDMLTESVEKYLNYALQNAIPTKKLVSESKYIASQKALDKISSILKINGVIQESKDGIFNDYENQIKEAVNNQNKLMVENADLKSKLKAKEAQLVLESKISKCTPGEAAFLRTYFENAKTPELIEEQIDDARAAYARIHAERRAEQVNKVKTAVSTPSGLVNESKKPLVKKDEPAKKVVTESKSTTTTERPAKATGLSSFLNAYAEMLKNN